MLDYLESTKAIRSFSEIFGKERRYRYIAALYMTEEQGMSTTDYHMTATKLKRKEVLAELIDKERLIELDPSFIQRLSDICIERGLAHTLLDRKTVSRLIETLESEQRVAKVTLAVPIGTGTNVMRILLKHPTIDENDPFYVNFVHTIRERRSLKKMTTPPSILMAVLPSSSPTTPTLKADMAQEHAFSVQGRLRSVTGGRKTSCLRTHSNLTNQSSSQHDTFRDCRDVDHELLHQYSTPRRRIPWESVEDDLLMAAYAISKARFKIISWTLIAEFIEKKEKLQCQRRIDFLLRSPASSHKFEEIMQTYESFLEQLSEEEREFTPKTPDDMRTLLSKELYPFRHFLTHSTQ
jgi:hypothetical protein